MEATYNFHRGKMDPLHKPDLTSKVEPRLNGTIWIWLTLSLMNPNGGRKSWL